MKRATVNIAILIFCGTFLCQNALSQTTAFVYQGNLNIAGAPANGNHDFEFALFDSLTGGTQLGTTLTRSNVVIVSGVFAVSLDFGSQFPGANRFLEIRVRVSGGGTFTPLSPRQQINSGPYSIKSINADNAVNASSATNATTANNAAQLGGVAANQYVLTSDPRMTDARNPLSGSANYIQNQNAGPQVSSNFNISGNGTAGGTLTGNFVNASTQFNIGGSRILSAPGTSNLFVGVDSGTANTTGSANAYFGVGSGAENLGGADNAFFGVNTGRGNTSGNSNSYFGRLAGRNKTTGNFNTGIGSGAGGNGNNGDNLTMLGAGADVGVPGLSFATAIGAGASVNTSNTVVLGRAADTVQVPGGLNVAGTLSGNVVSAASRFDIGGNRVLSIGGSQNTFLGIGTGALNTGSGNSFFGFQSGNFNSTGTGNSFFGNQAGLNNATAGNNSFFGSAAGLNNTTGANNSFFGGASGLENIDGSDNSFFGLNTGRGNTSGSRNSFYGRLAGRFNTTGNDNTFVGFNAGNANGTADFNTAFGSHAGENTTSGNNAFFGAEAGSGNTTGSSNAFFGRSAGRVNGGASTNAFFGSEAGAINTGGQNSFFGEGAGFANTSGPDNSFFGRRAGRANTTGGTNAFFGIFAGDGNTTGGRNVFIGANSGNTNATGAENTIIGTDADVASANLANATAIGHRARVDASNSLVLGGTTGVNGGTDTNVGIGTSAPGARLEVKDGTILSSGTTGGRFTARNPNNQAAAVTLDWINEAGTDIPRIRFGGSGVGSANGFAIQGLGDGTKLRVLNNGGLVVGPAGSITSDLTVNGKVIFGNFGAPSVLGLCRLDEPGGGSSITICLPSSIRFKKNVRDFAGGVDLLQRLRPVLFDWKSWSGSDLGLIAEEVEKIEPLLVARNGQGEIQGVRYDLIGVVAVNAVKEQQAQIDAQQRQIDEQRATIDSLKAALCEVTPQLAVCKEKLK